MMYNIDTIETVVIADNIFNSEDCEKIISIGNNIKKDDATVEVEGQHKVSNIFIRKNKVSWIDPYNTEFAFAHDKIIKVIHAANNQIYHFDIQGFQENLQFTEYSELNDHYGKHTDRLYKDIVRKLSVIVQLSNPNDYDGCELHVFDQEKPIIASKKQGSVIVFPSFQLHEVTPLLRGIRYSLVGWITGNAFR